VAHASRNLPGLSGGLIEKRGHECPRFSSTCRSSASDTPGSNWPFMPLVDRLTDGSVLLFARPGPNSLLGGRFGKGLLSGGRFAARPGWFLLRFRHSRLPFARPRHRSTRNHPRVPSPLPPFSLHKVTPLLPRLLLPGSRHVGEDEPARTTYRLYGYNCKILYADNCFVVFKHPFVQV
jgi:hypothetical protein